MANLGNAWHIPISPEPEKGGGKSARAGMRDPVGALVPGTAITLFSGNQFRGDGNSGNQNQAGSSLFFKRSTDVGWTELPLIFDREAGNNKYCAATIPANTFQTGDVVLYYLRIAYSDHDTTFVHASGEGSATTTTEDVARTVPFTFTIESSAEKGQWGPVFPLPNVAIHTHVLPNGLVLMWGRRDTNDLDDQTCTPFLWDPKNPADPTTDTNPRQLPVNLFCSGHAFLPDGRLLVVGGHRADADGLKQARLYNWSTNTWTATTDMEHGRWYPTATALPDGGILAVAGSSRDNPDFHNLDNQIWRNGQWTSVAKFSGEDDLGTSEREPLGILQYFPRMHVVSDGQVFMSGPLRQTYLLQTSNGSRWTLVGPRDANFRDYCPAVMYAKDKVVYIGGGNDEGTREPTREVERIDLSQTPPQWRKATSMQFRRRQHNATLLPDGTVLVTGGTRGGGPPNRGFNDLNPGQPVHVAELWDPKQGANGEGAWHELAAEEKDRCYHATAVLLPDATVLSAGGGEYRPTDGVNEPNNPLDSHRDAQIFSPPYLFKGSRPKITSAPDVVEYGKTFLVGTAQSNEIGSVSWIRLPSVTHSFDQNQRINFLDFKTAAGGLNVTAPNSANLCPPGHYMLFILSKAGVPSTARIIQIKAPAAPPPLTHLLSVVADAAETQEAESLIQIPLAGIQVRDRPAEVARTVRGTQVVIGITGTCPYGIAACWAGAYHALYQLEDVDLVERRANVDDSTATVVLKDERLPALDKWDKQFAGIVNGTYELRGVEVTLRGTIEKWEEQLFLAGNGQRPDIQLVPLEAGDKIQLNRAAGVPKVPEASESLAYEKIATDLGLANGQQVSITGPLRLADGAYRLHVRLFDVE